ncbi:MAG: SPFH domain-containing protein, partial [Anaerolineae bacterium]
TLRKFMQAFKSEHKVGIYYFRTAKLLNLRWGTDSPVKYQDPVYKFPVALRAFGNYSMRIVDGRGFFVQVVGGAQLFRVESIREPINARLVQPLTDYFAEAGLSYAQIDPNREEIAAGLSAKLKDDFTKLGFMLEDFRIQGTSFDEDTMRRINRIADIGAEAQAAAAAGISYAQLQQLAAMRDAAQNNGTAGLGMAMAVGMNMAGAATPAMTGATAQAAPSVPATPVPVTDPATKLKQLKLLFEQELITAEEYEAKKKEILEQL